MHIVLLAGGKGSRLWPASTESVPKQFVDLFDNKNSMLKKTYDLVAAKYGKDNIYIATSHEYKVEVQKKISDFKNFIFEPSATGTFGAILNTAVYLKEEKGISKDEIVSVIPIDHDVNQKFYDSLKEAEKLIKKDKSDICLVGITPTFPYEHYGYIVNKDKKVLSFREKPNFDDALELISNDALWNSGVLVFKLSKIIKIAKKYINYNSYSNFIDNYDCLPHTSFDYEVLEKEKDISVVKSDCHWNDLGTWQMLSPVISKEDKYNTNIINFEDKKIINDGVSNSIIINTKDGIRLVKKDISNNVIRSWGYYEVLNVFDSEFTHIKTKKLTILPGRNISYQYHKYRSEEWYILSGTGEVIIDGIKKEINPGDVIKVDKKQKHSIKAITKLEIVEVQHGDKKVEESDIVHLEYKWDKIKVMK